MRAVDVIRRKRDGLALSPEEIQAFISGYTSGKVPDYQAAALLMAVFLRGLADDELGPWTEAMLRSGVVVDLSGLPGAKVDKHSTGGVGDKISLPLAPAVAACGLFVPMISGRGLGHTGGTLDKLESIPGFRVDLPLERFRAIVRDIGLCLIGQTAEICPADRKLYALRDVTSTIESIPLIASSILSKKIAEGIDALVLDVKHGSGAFMKSIEDARRLARAMVAIGEAAGKKVSAVLTDMDQPLGLKIGNALEVEESLEVLRGGGPADVALLTEELGAEMLLLGGAVSDLGAGRARIREVLANGQALARFRECVRLQGGDPEALEGGLPRARHEAELDASADGFVMAIDTEAVGVAAMLLGAGRARKEDDVDPAVGIVLRRKVGDQAVRGERLATLRYNDPARLPKAVARLESAYRLGPEAPRPRPLVGERIRSRGLPR
jgi:pyrimidine-nucleoside phosphorylase/thymidine phosphorylase